MIHNNIYIHIGLPKTSSTHFQMLLSTIKVDKLLYNHEIFEEMSRLIMLFASKKISFKDSKINIIKEKLNNLILKNKDKYIFISDEGLAFGSTYRYNFDYLDKSIMLLNYLIPYAKIMLFIREHKSLIVSIYKQTIQQGNFQSFDDFIYIGDEEVNGQNTYMNGTLPRINIKEIQFTKIIGTIEKYYGKNKLFVFKYEILLKDYPYLFNKILHLVFSDYISKIKLNPILMKKRTYRSLSGLSIIIILTLKTILKPLVTRMNYNKEMKLFNLDYTNKDFNFLIKHFNWVRIRKLFINYLDKIFYIDLGFTKRKIKILTMHQDFFNRDDYDNIKSYEADEYQSPVKIII